MLPDERLPDQKNETTSPALEAQPTTPENERTTKVSAFKGLGLLDRCLALWILLAMAIGIILGNFVPEMGTALQKGTFVGVSIPIGRFYLLISTPTSIDNLFSCRSAGHDVPSTVQDQVRVSPPRFPDPRSLGTNCI